MSERKLLGWLGFGAAIVWLCYDYQRKVQEAIVAGWVTIGLTLAHIFLPK